MIINPLKQIIFASLATTIALSSSKSTSAAEDDCCGCFSFMRRGNTKQSQRLIPDGDLESARYSPPTQVVTPLLPVKKELNEKLEKLLQNDTPASRAIKKAIDDINEDASIRLMFINARVCKLEVTIKGQTSIVAVKLENTSTM